MSARNLFISLTLLCVSRLVTAESLANRQESASARRFVQGFYDWYAPRAVKAPYLGVVLNKKPGVLTPKLAKALREDLAAEARSNGDLVGLDFDPFLNSQDPVASYKVASIKKVGNEYDIKVLSAPLSGSNDRSSIIVVVIKRHGRWCFENFRYPEGPDLLTVLSTLKRDRAKPNR